MAHPKTTKRPPAPAAAPEPSDEDGELGLTFLLQTRVNAECRDIVRDLAKNAGMRPGTWLRQFLYDHLLPRKVEP